MQLWSVEGNRQRLDGGAMFGNAPRALWERWTPPDEFNRVELACRALLARDLDGKTVLFETGIGAFFEPRLRERYGVYQSEHVLLASLEALGVAHEDVDAVVLSHLHFDHSGGLLAAHRDSEPIALLFPKARFIVSRRAWERASKPHPRDRASFIPGLTDLLAASGRLEIVDGERSSWLGDAVRFELTDGHTPGLLHAELGGHGGVTYASDLIPGRPWVNAAVTMGYDRFPEQLIDEKRRYLEDKIARGVRLFFTHDADCALALPIVDAAGKFGTKGELATVAALVVD